MRCDYSDGLIKLNRSIRDSFLWETKPYDKSRAWIDLLLSAMHKDKKMLIDGKVIVVKQGSFMTSILKLTDKWRWNRKTVNGFLKMLESEQMISSERTRKGTIITIVNYGKYQIRGTTEGEQNKNTQNDKFSSGYVDYLGKNYKGGDTDGRARCNDTPNGIDTYREEYLGMFGED